MPVVYELWRKPMWMMCPMETFVLINNLQLHCPIGVMEQEQVIGNDFCINLRIGYEFTRAMTSDDVGDTLNYAAVYQRTREVLARPVALIEKAAGNVAQALLEEWPEITSIDLRIIKRNPPMGADCDGAGVEIHLINDKNRLR